ncbi:MAG: glycosyltransferase [Nitrosomonadales bacterium]|nr:glycosyltransferase [Nitrosomonadales bacterium]
MSINSPEDAQRIALFVPTLHGGGAERVMANLAIAFCERGIGVDLVLLKAEGPYLRELPPGVRVIDLDAPRLLAGLAALARYLRRERPLAMLAAMNHANVGAMLAALLSRSRVPIVVSEHNAASVSLDQDPGIKTAVLKMLMRALYPRARNIVAVSQGVADDLGSLLHLDTNRIRVIPNPIVNGKIRALAEQPVSHPWLSDKSVPVILAVGRLTLQKDFETLLRALGKAAKQRPMRLMILGEGELRNTLESLVAELGLSQVVALPGFVDNPYAYMKRADMFVLSSRWEGFGNVLVEAMACGVPVISTDCPSGPAEILENGKWGRLVPVGDADALALAMLDTLEHPGLSPAQRATDFSVDKAADAYLALLLADGQG